MSSPKTARLDRLLLFFPLALALTQCTGDPQVKAQAPPAGSALVLPEPHTDFVPSVGPVTPSASSAERHAPVCRLAAPKKSQDPCSTDADCGVSDPCHAQACVAKAKSHPRTPDVLCTMMLDCNSADTNRCGCFEGRCALIPDQGPSGHSK